ASGDLVEYDIDEAQDYWDKGLEELGEDSIELEFLAGDTETAKTMNEYIVNQLESNLEGLELTLKQVPFEQKDRKSTRLNSSHVSISYAVFCFKKKRNCTDTYTE